MSYCLAIKVDSGIVFASDSRTTGGPDHISTYSKMFTYGIPGDRSLVLLSAGNLGATQAVINAISRDIEDGAAKNFCNLNRLFEIAEYVGDISSACKIKYDGFTPNSFINLGASFIFGGQIQGSPPEIFLIYPEGNYINASHIHPHLQIGETKYGKPILDRIIQNSTLIEDAARCALISIDSTIRSNLVVGPPVELILYRRDSLVLDNRLSFDQNTPFFANIQDSWRQGLMQIFEGLPRFDWE